MRVMCRRSGAFRLPGWNALSQPEVTEADLVDPDQLRLARIPEFGDRVLRVIITAKKNPPAVVTVFFHRSRRIP